MLQIVAELYMLIFNIIGLCLLISKISNARLLTMKLRKEYDTKTLAKQLRLLDGSVGIKVGENMKKGNHLMNHESIKPKCKEIV